MLWGPAPARCLGCCPGVSPRGTAAAWERTIWMRLENSCSWCEGLLGVRGEIVGLCLIVE